MPFEIINKKLNIRNEDNKFSVDDFCKKQEDPFYLYDLEGIEQRFNYLKKGLSLGKNPVRIHYAMKANSHPLILQKLKSLGSRVDVVSLGEVNLALDNDFQPEDIIFSGVGKSKKEITESLKLGLYQINVESLPELERIGEIAQKLGLVARVGIRFNPDVNPDTHPYITTGFRENKFGLDFNESPNIDAIKKKYEKHIILKGMSIHIGSQIKETQSFIDAIDKTINVFKTLKINKSWDLESLDIGGGLGINYDIFDSNSDLELIDLYCQQVSEKLNTIDAQVICEPGRLIVGRFGALLGQIEYIKRNQYKNFAILNTGMHHLMRPALYSAVHTIVPVCDNNSKPVLYDVVGPICESADVLGNDRLFNELKQGEWLAVMDAGAYGAVMASHYNQHPPVKEFVYYKGELQS